MSVAKLNESRINRRSGWGEWREREQAGWDKHSRQAKEQDRQTDRQTQHRERDRENVMSMYVKVRLWQPV